jgi:hypothetical protein
MCLKNLIAFPLVDMTVTASGYIWNEIINKNPSVKLIDVVRFSSLYSCNISKYCS